MRKETDWGKLIHDYMVAVNNGWKPHTEDNETKEPEKEKELCVE